MPAMFGPAGCGNSFYEKKYKGSLDVPQYISEFGLDAFEYQCGRGVNVGEEKAREFGRLSAEKNIKISLHAPYYISMSSIEEEKRLNSVNYILQSAKTVDFMGGNRIVVHTGSCGKLDRLEALRLAKETMTWSLKALDEQGLGHIHICPETMGKINQLGTLEEVIALCELDERLIPCIDFGHLNARTLGEVNSKEAFLFVINEIGNRLGEYRKKHFHSHFSKIEYTKGGEKKHLTFEDNLFGPEPLPLIELLCELNLEPTIICESDGTQSEDALYMKNLYRERMSL